ncbi:MAG: hypothetical protein WDM84_08095 [Bauldia sp.]
MVETFRLLTPARHPELIIVRIETSDGRVHNFGVERKAFAHTAKVWAFDLGALDKAVEAGAPLPGTPFGVGGRAETLMRRSALRIADVTRALKATLAAGLQVRRWETDRDGKIVVIIGAPDAPAEARDLDVELREFEARHGND